MKSYKAAETMKAYVDITKTRRRIIVLSAVMILLLLSLLGVFVIYPFWLTHQDYALYGGMTDELRDSELYDDLQSGKTICFVGDSITYGNEADGIHWYHPLIPYTAGKIKNFSHGGWAVEDLIENKSRIPKADVYVIAIGTNDVVVYDEKKAAKDPDEYISRIEELTTIIKGISSDAKLYFITPWVLIGWGEKTDSRNTGFRNALIDWCGKSDIACIDPSPVIYEELNKKGYLTFMKADGCHPNYPEGVGLYSYAVLLADHNRKTGNQ